MGEFSDNIPARLRDLATLACADFNKEHIGHPMVREQRYEWLAADRIERLEAQLAALKKEKAEQYQLAQYYRVALQEIRDRTPANQHKEWPHHHWYLATATDAINHKPNSALLQGETQCGP